MKNFKTFLIGVITGALVVSAPVLADTIRKNIEVDENLVTIYVNGDKVEESNFLYNGRTFAPLREIAEKLGYEVTWDETTSSAYIGEVPNTVNRSNVFAGDVIGKFDGEPIYQSELDAYIKTISTDETYAEDDILATAKEELLKNRALEKFAKEHGLASDDMHAAEFDSWYNSALKQYGEDGLNKLFEQNGYTKNTYRYFYYLYLLRGDVMGAISAVYYPTDAQLQEYYDAHKENYAYDGLRAKHILIKTIDENGKEVSETDMKKAKKLADDVYKKAKSGVDFDKLIKEYGEDPGAVNSPNGYTFKKGEMVTEFETAAYSLEVGEISKPVKSQFGYHIIKLEEKIPYLTLNDVSVKEYIINLLMYENFDARIKDTIANTEYSWK